MPELTTASTMTAFDPDNDYLAAVDVSDTPDSLEKLSGAVLLGEVLKSLRTLTDPGADRVPFWDESANAVAWLTPGTGLSITGTSLNSASGISIGNEVTSSTTFNDLIVTAGADPGTIYHGIVTADFPITTAYAVPSNLFFGFVKGAIITDGGGGEIDFEGVGLLDPLSQPGCPYFSGFAAGDITWASTAADERPAAVSTELWDTGNTSLSDRLARANAAFGTKQIRIECHPRTITASVVFSANKEIYFSSGDYANTFVGAGDSVFILGNNTVLHGPRSARIYESTGAYGTRIVSVSSLTAQMNDITVKGVTFVGDPAAVNDGSSTTVLMGNCLRGSVENCYFIGVHAYGIGLGGFSSSGFYAKDIRAIDNVFTEASTQLIYALNCKGVTISRNTGDFRNSGGGGNFIDIEPNTSTDKMEGVIIEDNLAIMDDDQVEFLNLVNGIVVQAAGTAGIRGLVIRGNTVLGKDPSTVAANQGRLQSGITVIGATEITLENNTVRTAMGRGMQLSECRDAKIGPNHLIGCQSNSGHGDSLEIAATSNSVITGQVHHELNYGYGQSTGIYEAEAVHTATSSGSVITKTVAFGYPRFFEFHSGLSVFYNGSTYTISTVDYVNQALTMTAAVGTVAVAAIASTTDVDTTNNKLVKTAHGFENNGRLKYVAGTAPITASPALTDGQIIHVVNKTANDWQISATQGGAAMDLTGAGTGTQTFTPILETRFSSNHYSNNFAPYGHSLAATGTSQIPSTAHDRIITEVVDAGLALTTAHGIALHTGTTASRTDTLPDAMTCRGKEITVKDGTGNAETHNLIIDPLVAGQTVDGAASVAINTDYGMMTFKSNGANWLTVLPAPGGGAGIGGDTGATDNRLLRSDGTGGATAQNSLVTVDDSGNVTGVVGITTSGNIVGGSAISAAGGFYAGAIGVSPVISGATGSIIRLLASDGSNPVGLVGLKSLVVAQTSAYSITAFDCNATYTNEGATARQDFTLPPAAAGLRHTFNVMDADGIRVIAGAGDTIRIAGNVSAAAGRIDSVTIGDSVTLEAQNATEWVAVNVVNAAGWTAT